MNFTLLIHSFIESALPTTYWWYWVKWRKQVAHTKALRNSLPIGTKTCSWWGWLRIPFYGALWERPCSAVHGKCWRWWCLGPFVSSRVVLSMTATWQVPWGAPDSGHVHMSGSGRRGSGSRELRPRDRVLWRFTTWKSLACLALKVL